jgi:hypothetical protein
MSILSPETAIAYVRSLFPADARLINVDTEEACEHGVRMIYVRAETRYPDGFGECADMAVWEVENGRLYGEW